MDAAAEKLGFKDTKDCLIGTYDYKHYCKPTWPYGKGVRAPLPPFFGLNEKMPILLGMLMVCYLKVLVNCRNPSIWFSTTAILQGPIAACLANQIMCWKAS